MVPAIRQARARVVGNLLNRHLGARNRIFTARDRALNSAYAAGGDRIAKITPRTGRANAGFSRKVSMIRDWGNCVVADAVVLEPVSASKFPANREINREFRRIGVLVRNLIADTREDSETCSEIPYSTEQGIFAKEQGICTGEQGI